MVCGSNVSRDAQGQYCWHVSHPSTFPDRSQQRSGCQVAPVRAILSSHLTCSITTTRVCLYPPVAHIRLQKLLHPRRVMMTSSRACMGAWGMECWSWSMVAPAESRRLKPEIRCPASVIFPGRSVAMCLDLFLLRNTAAQFFSGSCRTGNVVPVRA